MLHKGRDAIINQLTVVSDMMLQMQSDLANIREKLDEHLDECNNKDERTN